MLMDNSTRVLPLFPAPLYVSKIKGLTKEKDFLIKQDYEGMDPQNGKISKDRRILNNKKVAVLRKKIKEHLNYYTQEILKINSKLEFYIANSWCIRHDYNDWAHKHYHPHAFISGCFYLKTPPGSGGIIFHKPYAPINLLSPVISFSHAEYNIYNSTQWIIPATENLLCLFPASLEHSVEVNNSQESRHCLAFNCNMKGAIGSSRHNDETKYD